LGGGWGSLQGLRGLLIDNLLSVELVTASGDLITVSATQNPDLFWALRGAGQNFGIVTSATYKVYDATNGGQVVNADFAFTAADNRSVWEYMQSYDESLPANMALSGFAFANATTREVHKLNPKLPQEYKLIR
jgi:FAD/FMN-containing dehydrogenase